MRKGIASGFELLEHALRNSEVEAAKLAGERLDLRTRGHGRAPHLGRWSWHGEGFPENHSKE
jgi:hypothetical protein